MPAPAEEPRRPDFEGLETWCLASRRWRLATGLVPLLVGLVSIAWGLSGSPEGLQQQTQLLFGGALCIAAVLPVVQARERSDWLRLLGVFRARWDEGSDGGADEDERRRLEALVRRLRIERMKVAQ